MKIAVYSIAKDEQKHVDRFMDSCVGADYVIVGVDPGDTTGDLLEARGATVHRIDIPKFRFDHYRNAVLKKIPLDVDVCISLDLDEVLPVGWREIVERDWKKGTTRLHYWLCWDPERGHTFRYDRIHARHGYEWRYPNHEAVVAISNQYEVVSQSQLTVTQYADFNKDRTKNLSLLEDAVAEDPSSVRMTWYLGREYYMLERYEDSIVTFRKYLSLEPQWSSERAWACIFVSRCYRELNLIQDSIAWLNMAIRTAPDLRDGYVELARVFYGIGRLGDARNEIDCASRINVDTHNFFHTNGAHGIEFHLLSARIYSDLGLNTQADYCCRHALRINPECEEAVAIIESLK